MTHQIVMPDLGQTTAQGKILRWLKKPGEHVARGEALLEVETDKVTMEVEAFQAGYLKTVLVREGEMADAMAPIAILSDEPVEFEQGTGAGFTGEQRIRIKTRKTTATATPAGPTSKVKPAEVPAQPIHAPAAVVETALTRDLKLSMYRRMLLCRMFEESVYYLFLQGRLPGTIHQSQGQEASAVGVCSALAPGDMITSTHRPHSHAIARGLPVNTLMAELFARDTGCCRGKGGSMHLGDREAGMLPAIAIVGGGIPLAVGYALSFQYLRKPNIVACFFGDGATNIGTFHEAVNMAAIWTLPVVFVCENNKYAASTAVEKVMKVKHVSERASSYGIPGETLDGNDVELVHHAMRKAAQRARNGQGPTLLELETYRIVGHSRSDPGHYRSAGELEAWKERDPISTFEKKLMAEGILNSEAVLEIKSSIEGELEQAVAQAEKDPSPKPEDCLNDVFAP